jgi:hypothetical protein
MHPPAYMNEILFGQKNFLQNKENFLLLTDYMLSKGTFGARLGAFAKNSELLNIECLKPSNGFEFPTAKGTEFPTAKGTEFPTAKGTTSFNKDTLFWSIFVAISGVSPGGTTLGEQEYYKLKNGGHNMVNVMMNLKKEISDHFNKNPEQLKLINHRITLAKINEIKCNLMTKPMDTIESCIPFAIYFNRPIIVYFSEYNCHVRFVSKNYISEECLDETIYLTLTNNKIILQKPESLGFREQSSLGAREQSSLGFELYHYEKPLQGASNYKGDELKTIYNQIFKINEGQSGTKGALMKKTEYYETIMVKCSSALQTKIK